jgi:hypothetical protein
MKMNPKTWFVMFGGNPISKGSQAQAQNAARLQLMQGLNAGSDAPASEYKQESAE